MTKTLMLLTVICFGTVSSQALAERMPGKTSTELCILYTQACSGKLQRFQQKIAKIQANIATDATVYNRKEIEALEKKLKKAEDQMDRMLAKTPQR